MSPITAPPADEPSGRMKLWWPPSVPYAEFDGATAGDVPESDTAVSSTAESSSSGLENPNSGGSSNIYAFELDQGSFRLACLTASTNYEDPVHVDLETYALDNCPEYEAVSYTWGGEEGDSTNSRPVYVGPYWDVLMQTRNCWEMLRFLRPRRGIRLVWTDAVCINQQNIPERSVQVANMGRIYSECSQVVVYLGPDIAPVLPAGRYPRRHKLQDVGSDGIQITLPRGLNNGSADVDGNVPARFTLENLLQRRYFSRLWVVQELILGKRVVMRIGDVDFWTDAGTPSTTGSRNRGPNAFATQSQFSQGNLNSATNLTTMAPWFQHLSEGTLSTKDVTDLMALTRHAHCADPRDHLFGILGLLPLSEPDSDPLMTADYSLSCQHVYIGLFAHMIIEKGLWPILTYRSNVRADSSSRPSWVPDWTSKETWHQLWMALGKVQHYQAPKVPVPTDRQWDDFLIPMAPFFPSKDTHVLYSINYPDGNDRIECWMSEEPRVDAKTGAFDAAMTRFLEIQSQPILIHKSDPWSLFKISSQGREVLLTSPHPLDQLLRPGVDALYLSRSLQDQRWPSYLILRKHPASTQSRVLVASCTLVLFPTPQLPRANPRNVLRENLSKYMETGSFATTLHRAISILRLWLDQNFSRFEQRPFPGLQHYRQALDVYQTVVDELLPGPFDRKGRQFEDAYVACFHADMQPMLSKDRAMFGLSLNRERWQQWKTSEEGKGFDRFFDNLFECYNQGQDLPGDISERFSDDTPWLRSSATWRLIGSITTIKKKLFHLYSEGRELLKLIRRAHERMGEPEAQLLSRSPIQEDHSIILPLNEYSRMLLDDFGCELTNERIHIL